MLRGEIDAAEAASADALLAAYESALGETIDHVGLETVAEESDVSRTTLEAIAAGRSASLSVEEAAAILATEEGRPDAEAIVADARDMLLMGMTTAVLDVESLAADLGSDLDPTELQQKIEGRHPMSLPEFARIHHHLATVTD